MADSCSGVGGSCVARNMSVALAAGRAGGQCASSGATSSQPNHAQHSASSSAGGQRGHEKQVKSAQL